MPVYVYGCTVNREHPRKEVVHGYDDNPLVLCGMCGAEMVRVPQSFRWGRSAWDVLSGMMDERYRQWKYKQKRGVIR